MLHSPITGSKTHVLRSFYRERSGDGSVLELLSVNEAAHQPLLSMAEISSYILWNS